MNRRESLKVLALGSLTLSTVTGCGGETEQRVAGTIEEWPLYGRTPEESAYDEKLLSEIFFTEHEMATLSVLTDILIPACEKSGGAIEAQVPDFIEFIVKDKPEYQHPLRGGMMWLDHLSSKEFGVIFLEATQKQKIMLIDRIAFPGKAKKTDYPGVMFFSLLRNLTATGYFTSQIGIQYLGYKGNVANFWDGVPDDVLEQYGLIYDQQTIDNCIKEEQRGEMVNWQVS